MSLDPLENIYAAFTLVLQRFLFAALLVAAFVPPENRKQILQRLRRLQFENHHWQDISD